MGLNYYPQCSRVDGKHLWPLLYFVVSVVSISISQYSLFMYGPKGLDLKPLTQFSVQLMTVENVGLWRFAEEENDLSTALQNLPECDFPS